MGIQETAQDVKHLVQALAEGKDLETRERNSRDSWAPYITAEGCVGFNLKHFDYRIKRDPLETWRTELLDYVIDYGRQTEKAAHCFVRNNQRDGAKHDAQAEAALNAFKSKLAFGPKGFK